MADSIRILSSMAPRRLLESAIGTWNTGGNGSAAELKSMGGVDAARTIEAGADAFDVVVLASGALAKLDARGCLVHGTAVGLASARVALAVRAGAPKPAALDPTSVRQAVLAAASIGYSTGPSGTAMLRLFETWGIADTLRGRLVQAQPGTPVGALVASGKAELGFQQLSELSHVDGIDVVGVLPPPMEIRTVFSGAIVRGSKVAEDAKALLVFIASAACDGVRRGEGLDPAAAG